MEISGAGVTKSFHFSDDEAMYHYENAMGSDDFSKNDFGIEISYIAFDEALRTDYRKRTYDSIDNFSKQFKIIKTEKKMVLKMFIVAVIQGLAYYSITYMIYKAFGNTGITFWQIIPTQAILLLMMMFIPTPGSGIGAEGGFYLLFNKIFKEGTINMSILFWRIYTFYLPIIVGVLFLIPSKNKTKNNTKK